MGGLDEKVSDSLLWELFVQAGPVVNVHMPKDRVTMLHQVSEKCAWEFGNVLKLPWVICTLSHLGWVALSHSTVCPLCFGRWEFGRIGFDTGQDGVSSKNYKYKLTKPR